MIARMRSIVFALLVASAACGGTSLKERGESCTASSECVEGLVCDLNVPMHVCQPTSTPIDAREDPPDADPDAVPVDAPPGDGPPIDAPPIDARPDAPPIDAMPDAPDIDAA